MNANKIGVYSSNNLYGSFVNDDYKNFSTQELKSSIETQFNSFLPRIKDDCLNLVLERIEPYITRNIENIEEIKEKLINSRKTFNKKMEQDKINEYANQIIDFVTSLKSNLDEINSKYERYCDKLPQLDEIFIIIQNMLTSYKTNIQSDRFNNMNQDMTEVKNALNVYISMLNNKLASLTFCDKNYEEIIVYKNLTDKLENIDHFVDTFNKKVFSYLEEEVNQSFQINGNNVNVRQKSEFSPLFFRKSFN
jgi:hypothetical protein